MYGKDNVLPTKVMSQCTIQQYVSGLMYMPGLTLTCSMYEPHDMKPKLTSRITKIEKHEFICNLRFCNVIILFVTTCLFTVGRESSW